MNWPQDKTYTQIIAKRHKLLIKLKSNPKLIPGFKRFYKDNYINFIEDWCITYDPRNIGSNKPASLPFILFDIQKRLCDCIFESIKEKEHVLVEKTRDMGATWVCCAMSIWLWLFHTGVTVGWGSRKEILVDRKGDTNSIFEKMRTILKYIPYYFLSNEFRKNEDKYSNYMRLINPENDNVIVGEAGDLIGRGGRTTIFFKDESSYYEHPESIEAALSENTDVQIDISTPNGTNNVFYKKRNAGEVWSPDKKIESGKTRIFIMDWKNHPLKNQEWYEKKKNKAEREGLYHIFAQEIDRDYRASIENILIKPEWVKAAIDAHKKIKFPETSKINSALDVADEEGKDKNALIMSRGNIVFFSSEWNGIDTTKTAEKTAMLCRLKGSSFLQYDGIGVGAGVKGELNRLRREEKIPHEDIFRIKSWIASSVPNNFKRKIDEEDYTSLTNKEFFGNLKTQSWWLLRQRFINTYKAVKYPDDKHYQKDNIISISSDIDNLHEIENELSQVTYSIDDQTGKIKINKKPAGTKSPNLADAIVMLFNPAKKYG